MRLRQRFGSRRGNAMIEFAMAAMVLTYSFSAVFQLGYSMYVYNELVGAVRAGARYASLAKVSNDGSTTLQAAYTTAVQNMTVYGNTSPAAGDQPVVPALTTGQVSVTVPAADWAVATPKYITVSINGYAIDAVFKTYTLTNKPSLRVPFFGQYCLVSASTC
jgi:Flp pilus assembly protein TadG